VAHSVAAGGNPGTTPGSRLTPSQDNWLRVNLRGRVDLDASEKAELEALYPMLWRLWPELHRKDPYAFPR
jgi:hypothetical protein